MEQKYKLGDKVKIIVQGEIKEAYIAYDAVLGDVIKYKVTSPGAWAIGVSQAEVIKED